jgi:hypothetical protein
MEGVEKSNKINMKNDLVFEFVSKLASNFGGHAKLKVPEE